VILTSDHGMYLGEHGRMGKHTVDPEDPWPLLDEVAAVPLLVWSPWQGAPAATGALVQPADIHPTVLELCGLEPGAPDGRPFTEVLRGEAEEHRGAIYSSCHSWHGPGTIDYLKSLVSVITPRWTLVVGPEPHEPELYSRRGDPEQQHNVAETHPEVVKRLRGGLVEFMTDHGADPRYVQLYALGITEEP
jgi:arylsulfatase A-like enzyme